jgi:hypothetical protein
MVVITRKRKRDLELKEFIFNLPYEPRKKILLHILHKQIVAHVVPDPVLLNGLELGIYRTWSRMFLNRCLDNLKLSFQCKYYFVKRVIIIIMPSIY